MKEVLCDLSYHQTYSFSSWWRRIVHGIRWNGFDTRQGEFPYLHLSAPHAGGLRQILLLSTVTSAGLIRREMIGGFRSFRNAFLEKSIMSVQKAPI